MMDRVNRIIGILVIIGIVVFGFFWFFKFKINQQSSKPTGTQVNTIKNYDKGQLPSLFPSKLPIETDAKIISSYNAVSPQKQAQATVVFESSKSVAANFSLYYDYLSKNNWKIVSKNSSSSDLQSIVAKNLLGVLTVTIHKGSNTSSVVDLTFLLNR